MENLLEEANENVKGLSPFTLEDAEEDMACLLCEYRESCPIIAYVNKLSLKRDGKVADSEFYCSIFKEEEEEITV